MVGLLPSPSRDREEVVDIPASASEEKFPVHTTYVDPSLGPVVTGYSRMVDTTLEYVSAGVDEMTEYVMK